MDIFGKVYNSTLLVHLCTLIR